MSEGKKEFVVLEREFDRIVRRNTANIKAHWPKLDTEDENYSLFAGKILMGEGYFYFRCRLTNRARGRKEEVIAEIKERYSNGYIRVFTDGTLEIAINNREKLGEFLSDANEHIEDGSVRLLR